mgnify:CR=1 FL=1
MGSKEALVTIQIAMNSITRLKKIVRKLLFLTELTLSKKKNNR